MNLDNIIKQYFDWLSPQSATDVQTVLSNSLDALKKIGCPTTAVVLGGGWKHKEITRSDNKILTDVDIFLFSNLLPFYWSRIKRIEKQLNATSTLKIHIQGVIPLLLCRSKTLWAYRLKQEGIVLSGNKNILNHIQAQKDNIPPTEIIRILFQTLIMRINLFKTMKYDKTQESYQALRAYLYIGETYLAWAGRLDCSYSKRSQNFEEVAKQLSLDQSLVQKVKASYKVKVDYFYLAEYQSRLNFNLDSAKLDCLTAIQNILSCYFNNQNKTGKQLDQLSYYFVPKPWFNFIFWLRIRSLGTIKPNFLKLFLWFKPTDLYKIAYCHETDRIQERNKILNCYFNYSNFTDKILIQLFKAWPTPALVEIA